jgi:hypothetical protein
VPTLGIAQDFLREFGRLQKHVQDRVYETFAKFRESTVAGIHLEKIHDVRDPRLMSIRIDNFWRGVVLAPNSGDAYLLLRVLPHDEAYRWAQRRAASVNRATGGIEIRDVVAIESRLPSLAEQAATTTERLLSAVNDVDLRRLGVDDQVLAFARTLTSIDQLDAARAMLPEPQYDALMGLAAGMSAEEVWAEVAGAVEPGDYDPNDVTAAALARSTKQVVLVTGPDELMEVFSYPFDLWRVYLHPVQHRVAYGDFSGPLRVTGGPGTGKTVAVLHRAKHLAAHRRGGRGRTGDPDLDYCHDAALHRRTAQNDLSGTTSRLDKGSQRSTCCARRGRDAHGPAAPHRQCSARSLIRDAIIGSLELDRNFRGKLYIAPGSRPRPCGPG